MAQPHSKKLKPKKPFPSFPLTPHANGQWCKKIRGKVHFFGVWADPRAAQEEYNRQAADLHAGRTPPPKDSVRPTTKHIANAYLAAQKAKAEHGLITAHWFDDCLRAMKDFASFVGNNCPWDSLSPADFSRYRMNLYDRYGVCTVDRYITIVRAALRHAYDTDLIDRPIKYGGQFNKPSRKEQRQNRINRDRENGKRLLAANEIRTLVEHAGIQLRAMILLGINGGFGNTDCAELPVASFNLKGSLIDYERPKTAVPRVVPLWPETRKALERALNGKRPAVREPEYRSRMFLTVRGNPWKKESLGKDRDGSPTIVRRQQAISSEFNKLLVRLKMKRPGLGFYALRHTFRTWADEANDQHAIHRIMGHAIPGMSGIYVEEISVKRLRVVVNHVRKKVFNRR